MWPPDPGSVAIGGLVGVMFWIFAMTVYFPWKFRTAETRIEHKVETKVREGIVEFKADVKKEVGAGIDGFIARFSDPEDEKANMLIAAMTGKALIGISESQGAREIFKPLIHDLVGEGLVEFENRLGLQPETIAQTMADMQHVIETVKAYLPQQPQPGQQQQPQQPGQMGGLFQMFAPFMQMFPGMGGIMGLPQLGP